MAKTIVNVEYVKSLNEFVEQLKAAQKDFVYVESGRKFDKIIIGNGVRYFIDRSKGIIYGSKSRLAPNMKWHFGTLSNASKWDWSGFHGVPVNDDSVRLVGEYGTYKHYEPIDLNQKMMTP